jgi:hypothetical protein
VTQLPRSTPSSCDPQAAVGEEQANKIARGNARSLMGEDARSALLREHFARDYSRTLENGVISA